MVDGDYTFEEGQAIADAYMDKALDRLWLNKGFDADELEAWGDLGDELIWRMCLYLKKQDDARKRREQADVLMGFFG